jgi:hypothetical protein
MKKMNVYEKNMSLKSDEELLEIINSNDNSIMIEVLDAAKKEVEKRSNIIDIPLENNKDKSNENLTSNVDKNVKIIKQWVSFFGVTYIIGLIISILIILNQI